MEKIPSIFGVNINLAVRSEYANAFLILIVRTASSCKVDIADRLDLLVQNHQFRNRTKDPKTK